MTAKCQFLLGKEFCQAKPKYCTKRPSRDLYTAGWRKRYTDIIIYVMRPASVVDTNTQVVKITADTLQQETEWSAVESSCGLLRTAEIGGRPEK